MSLTEKSPNNVLIAEFRRDKKKTGFENAHRVCDWHSVEVFDLDLGHEALLAVQCHFEDVTLHT